jgi:hypothetical protein
MKTLDDADDVEELNNELFGDGSEVSYGGMGAGVELGFNGGPSRSAARLADEVQSADQEHESSRHETPRQANKV